MSICTLKSTIYFNALLAGGYLQKLMSVAGDLLHK